MRAHPRFVPIALILAIAGVWAGGAGAQPGAAPAAASSDSTTGQARTLFNEGTDRAHRGDWSPALDAFVASDALRPHAVTTYNIAYCERALGHYTRARKAFGHALAENAAHGGVELPDDLAASAKGYLAELEGQIARLVVTLAPDGVSVLVDGRPLERAAAEGPRPVLWAGTREVGAAEPSPASTFELEIDPGAHVVVLSRAGYADDVITRTFERGPETSIAFELGPAVAAAPVAPPRETPVTVADQGRAPGASSVALYVPLVVAAGGLATGLVAGAVALDLKGEGPEHYGGARSAADVATVSFIVGGVGTAAAALIWFLSSKPSRPVASRSPRVSPTVLGVEGVF
jgi:hypothetical protein